MALSPDPDGPESLVTPASLALSLSPPRAPPHGTDIRNLLVGADPSAAGARTLGHDGGGVAHSSYVHHALRDRIHQIVDASHLDTGGGGRLPHPHLPAGPELADRLTRAIGAALPVPWQNAFRDSGRFRSLADGLVAASVPSLAVSKPSAAASFLRLSKRRVELRYGRHAMQGVDLFEPEGGPVRRGLVFFVHGGAWGSGHRWMYRLVAPPFIDMGLAVAVAGYRTYPDADVSGQVDDLRRAAEELWRQRPDLWRRPEPGGGGEREDGWLGTCLIGHSSGAHIALLLLVEGVTEQIHRMATGEAKGDVGGRSDGPGGNVDNPQLLPRFDSFIGLSGPYDISHHFDYEAGRGVEEISPLKPACGLSRESFRSFSPAVLLRRLLAEFDEGRGGTTVDDLLPRMLLVHGVEDATVPFTATAEAARILRSCGAGRCDELYLAGTGHQDVVMHLMLGGKAKEGVLRWLRESRDGARAGDRTVAGAHVVAHQSRL